MTRKHQKWDKRHPNRTRYLLMRSDTQFKRRQTGATIKPRPTDSALEIYNRSRYHSFYDKRKELVSLHLLLTSSMTTSLLHHSLTHFGDWKWPRVSVSKRKWTFTWPFRFIKPARHYRELILYVNTVTFKGHLTSTCRINDTCANTNPHAITWKRYDK
jgi:hypothetical protein